MATIVAAGIRRYPSDEPSLLPVVFISLAVHVAVFAGIPLLTKIIYRSEKYERPRTFQLVSPALIKTPIQPIPRAKTAVAQKKTATTPVPKKQNSRQTPKKEAAKEENINDLSELLDAVPTMKASDIAAAQDFKYHWYLQNLVSKVEEQWKPPLGLTDKKDAGVVVTFTISQNGSISNPSVEKSSGVGTLDALALRAIRLAAPFGKLPIGFAGDKLDITYTLYYFK